MNKNNTIILHLPSQGKELLNQLVHSPNRSGGLIVLFDLRTCICSGTDVFIEELLVDVPLPACDGDSDGDSCVLVFVEVTVLSMRCFDIIGM